MKENLKDILSNLHSEVDQETLLKYLEGKLSAEEQHEVEKNTLDDAFEADALEGLQDFTNKAKIAALVEQLNQDIKKKTDKKKKQAHKREAKVESWLLVALVLILLIAVIGFFIIRKMQG
jgi:anti-sigma factor RsiW